MICLKKIVGHYERNLIKKCHQCSLALVVRKLVHFHVDQCQDVLCGLQDCKYMQEFLNDQSIQMPEGQFIRALNPER